MGRVKVLEQRRVCALNNKILKIFPGKIRKPSLDNSGYFGLKLFNGSKNYKSFKIHQLVAQNFLIKMENETEINHKNGIKTDNRLENLEWCSRSENQKHAYKLNLQPSRKGEAHPRSQLTASQVKEIRRTYIPYKYTVQQLSKEYGVSYKLISNIIYKKTWQSIE